MSFGMLNEKTSSLITAMLKVSSDRLPAFAADLVDLNVDVSLLSVRLLKCG